MLEGKRIAGGAFTLIELMIAVCIMAILAGLAGIRYSVWIKRYNVEREIRQMHADLMNARARALMRNRLHFVTLAANRYAIYDDTYNNAVHAYTQDGDGALQTTSPRRHSGTAEEDKQCSHSFTGTWKDHVSL